MPPAPKILVAMFRPIGISPVLPARVRFQEDAGDGVIPFVLQGALTAFFPSRPASAAGSAD
jgi:hypothetical protein